MIDGRGMIAAMPVTHRARATVITSDLTYKAHELQIDESARVAAVFDRNTWEPVAILTDCEWSSQDRSRYRVEGLDGNGDRQVWASFAVCARCSHQMVVPTPDHDVPT